MCKACPALDFQKSHQLKQERIIGQKGEIKLFLEVMIRRNFNSWVVRALIASKQTAQKKKTQNSAEYNGDTPREQNVALFSLKTLSKGLRTSPEAKFPLISSVY